MVEKKLNEFEKHIFGLMENSVQCVKEGLEKENRATLELGLGGLENCIRYFRDTRKIYGWNDVK